MHLLKLFRDVIIENILVILFGILIFFLDSIEFKDAYSKVLILSFSLGKTIYFLASGFKKIVRFTKLNLTYYQFLAFIGLNIAMIIFSFAIDCLCLYQVDPFSFSGVPITGNFFEKLFNFFYFSLLIFSNIGMATIMPETMAIFSNIGMATIMPETMAAKSLTMLESVLSFVTIIFILSDFISLKESLSGYLKKKKPEQDLH